eukprot:m.214032 g.214032  ORF g.214032 m.214032 type:complete len:76 (-) comp15091_c0_seq1:49-276(-)
MSLTKTMTWLLLRLTGSTINRLSQLETTLSCLILLASTLASSCHAFTQRIIIDSLTHPPTVKYYVTPLHHHVGLA